MSEKKVSTGKNDAAGGEGGTEQTRQHSQDSHAWLRVTLSSIGDAVITTDPHGRVTFLNPVAQALTGWTQEDAVGASLEQVFRIVNEDTRATVESPTVRALREGVVVGLANHTLLFARDGTERPVDDSAAPIRDENGDVAGVVLVFRDVTERRHLEHTLADALAYAQAILATVRHAFLVLDAGLKVRSANAAFYRRFETTEAETLGRPVHELGNGQWDIPALRTLLEKILPARSSFEDFEVEHDFPRIGHRVLLVNARRIQDGDPDGLILMSMEDATERKRLEGALQASELRYRRLFQTAKDGILILDASTGKIIDANAFMAGLLGQELPELLGKELHEIGMFRDITANKAAFEELKQNGYIRYEHLPIQNRSGGITHVEFVSNVYDEDDRLVAQCNVRNISARVAMEKEIDRQAAALADQHRRKDEFLAMLSHELRNPLAPLRAAVHLLRLQERAGENLIQRQAREVIERQLTNLTRLVSDLLEVSRVVSGRVRLERETLDLTQAVRYSIETAGPQIERRKHHVSLAFPEQPVWVNADPGRLEQIVTNLLTNATKFTDEGGRIEVSVERHHNHAELRVRDSGIGIAPEMLPHIFELFAQADRSLDRSQGGLGIGLHLVHRMVEMHGGTVEAESVGVGHGTEFIVRLPVAPAPGEQPAVAPAEGHGTPRADGLRVLIVDDNVDACAMLAILVRLQGSHVQVAHTGPAALTTAKAWPPDVVLLDIGLPEVDGYEVARRLRADPVLKGVHLVALTGYGSDVDRELAREAGFDSHLLKPVDLAVVEKLLAAWNEARLSKPT